MTTSMPEPPELPDDFGPPSPANDALAPAPRREIRTGFCEMTADEYHADPLGPSLSSSIANVLDKESPAHAYTRHPRLGGVPRPDTKAFDAGTLAHALLLGAGKRIEIIEADDWKTKAAREAREVARTTGRLPVLAAVYEEATEVADTLRERFAEKGIVLDGESEVAMLWGEESTRGLVQCRGMIDHLKIGGTGRPTILDLKSCRSASLTSIQRSCDSFGYDIQNKAYTSAVEHIRPELAGRLDYVLVFFELVEPFVVTPVRLSGAFRELGARRWKGAVESWARCMNTGHWPGYVDTITDLDPPTWALARDMDKQLATRNWVSDVPFGGDDL